MSPRDDLAAALARLVTLAEASRRIGKPVDYFKIRRFRCPEDFPVPVNPGEPNLRYDLQELVLWDERRKASADERRKEGARATLAAKQATAEKKR